MINFFWLLLKDWLDSFDGRGERGFMRSREWPKARRAHLEKEPFCRWCGRKHFLNVHHIQPFHLNPALELDENNFITLCEGGIVSVVGLRKYANCHFRKGHESNWKDCNPRVREECEEHDKKKETSA